MSLNRHLERRGQLAKFTSVVSNAKMIAYDFSFGGLHLPHAPYDYKSYWLCDRCERDVMLKKNQQPSMTSTRSRHLIKLLMLIGVSIQQRLSLQRYHRLTM